MKAIKRIRAGLLNYEILGKVPEPKERRGRAPRSRATCAAQLFYNNKRSWQEAELVIAKNFGSGDMVVTYTYDEEHLPKSKAGAQKCLHKHFRKLRTALRRRGIELKYLYVTEGFHDKMENEYFNDDGEMENRRWHHHVVVNASDADELRSLWEYGYVRVEPLNVHYYQELAKYLTKEAREFGRAKPGERTWNSSRNLDRKVEVEYIDIPIESVTLTAPEGAIDYTQFHEKNPYGYADCIGARYLLYPKETPPPLSYAAGRKSKKDL